MKRHVPSTEEKIGQIAWLYTTFARWRWLVLVLLPVLYFMREHPAIEPWANIATNLQNTTKLAEEARDASARAEGVARENAIALKQQHNEIVNLKDQVAIIRRVGENLRRRLEDMSASEKIARYNQDPGSSIVFGPCERRSFCRLRFTLQRTEEGLSYRVASADPVVSNHSGEPHESFYDTERSTIVGEIGREDYKFIGYFWVPGEAERGWSTVWAKMKYEDVDPETGEVLSTVKESTIALAFEII